ncbi:MAG: MFS transporter [Acidimicrobiales bacterium]
MASADFRRLFANGFYTTGARWTEVLARGWLVHDLSDGSTAAVGWITFLSFIPFVLVGPFAGALADRFDRRLLLIRATVVGIAGAALLALITITGVAEVWHVGVLAFLTGSAQAATVPTRQALIATVVPPEDLLNAVALGGISRHGSRVVGPLFGAAFLGLFGAGSVFVFSAVLLGLGLLVALGIEYRRPADPTMDAQAASAPGLGAAAGRLVTDLGAAGRYVKVDRRLLTVVGLVAAHCSLTMAFDSMMPTMAEEVGGAAGLYSGILVGLGLGAITGTVAVSQIRHDQTRGLAFAASGLGSGLAMILLGTAGGSSMLLVGGFLAGLTQASYMTMSAALIQRIVTDEYRGRVMSFYIMIAAGHMAILNLGYGWTAEFTNVRLLLVGPGIAWIVIFVLAIGLLPGVRSLVRRGRFASMESLTIAPGLTP